MDCISYQADSIFMNTLRSAMENAHAKVQSRVGPIEFLYETLKFYELAIIQINATLNLIKQQPEGQIKIHSDLIKLKDLLHDRLDYTKCLITKKDKELMKRLENEKELDFEPKFQSYEEKTEQNILLEQMSSDFNILNEIFDATFARIHMNEVRDLDQELRCSIEKETILIVIKEFIHNQSVEYYKNQKKDAIIEERHMKQQQQESSLQTMAMEEHYMILLNDCYKDFWSCDIEMQVKEDVFVYALHEVAKDWRVYDENESIKVRIADEICKSVFVETMNDIQMKLDFKLQKIRNEELVYKKAFVRRCENLLLAEKEVDLLGDQVEALKKLVRKIYFMLDQNLLVLSSNSQVRDILKLIRKEFNN